MYRGKRIAVVMPAFDVQAHVEQAVRSVPAFVDELIVVDDASRDDTARRVSALRRPGLHLLRHTHNRGVGAAIGSGYAEALRRQAEVIAVMAGDAQMDPADLPALLDPVVSGAADYAKGNRFSHPTIWRTMPTARIVGSIVLSLLTKLSSGYWRVFDSQCGYTAISCGALRAIGTELYPRYGYPNALLAELRTVGARLAQVPVRPVYEGQASGIRLQTVLHHHLAVLLRSLLRRTWRSRLRPLLRPGRGRPRLLASNDADRRPDDLVPAPRR